MKTDDMNIDDLLTDVSDLIGEETAEEFSASGSQAAENESFEPDTIESAAEEEIGKDSAEYGEETQTQKKTKSKKKSGRKVWTLIGKIAAIVLETVLLLAVALYGFLFVLAKGPSPTARDLFVMSVRETSAMGWVADIFFTEEEIAQIENKQEVEDFTDTDTSLIQIPKETEPDPGESRPEDQGPVPDEWGLVDEDGDGIIIEEVKGEGYAGYMMVVLDPSRVIMGSVPTSYGGRGYTVAEMVEHFDAVAGINAGGFHDPNGSGNGSIPDTLVVYEGKVYYENNGTRTGFVGFDSNHIMHVATRITSAEIKEKDIQYGVCFGPVLIANGEPCTVNISGVNPRTAIGQRSDGAVLMLVIDGRQVISMGATHQDLIDIMMDYGAVNACNLDGGSSTLMWYDGDYVNNCASVIGIRPVPTTFLVLKEGESGNG